MLSESAGFRVPVPSDDAITFDDDALPKDVDQARRILEAAVAVLENLTDFDRGDRRDAAGRVHRRRGPQATDAFGPRSALRAVACRRRCSSRSRFSARIDPRAARAVPSPPRLERPCGPSARRYGQYRECTASLEKEPTMIRSRLIGVIAAVTLFLGLTACAAPASVAGGDTGVSSAPSARERRRCE